MYTTPTAVRDALVSEIQDVIRQEMTWFPSIVALESDVIDVTLDLLPDPEGFNGLSETSTEDARDYLDEVRSCLDLDGSMLRESIEALFTGIVYTSDSVDFWREYENECDEAANEYGLFYGMKDITSVSDMIVRVADYGGMMMLSNKASDICEVIGYILEQIESELPE